MSSRTGFVLATFLLLIAALLRGHRLPQLPPGFSEEEYISLRIVESQRAGHVAVFYDHAPGEESRGRDGLYPALLGIGTLLTGGGAAGYRALSLFISLLTLAVVYALTRKLCGTFGAAAALALLAFSLWPVLLGRSVTPVALTPLLAAATMLGLTQVLSVPARMGGRLPGTNAFAALGLVAALGIYAHPVQFWLVAAALLFIYWLTRIQGPLTLTLSLSLFFVLLIMLIALAPYGLSMLRLFELGGLARLLGDYDFYAGPPLQSIVRNLAGVLFVGDASPLHNLPGRPLIDLASGVIALVGVMVTIRFRRRPRFALPLIFFLVLAPPALLVNDSPNFAAMAVLLPLLALFFGFGAAALSVSLGRGSRFVPAIALLVLPAANLLWTSHDFYRVWAHAPDTLDAWNGRSGQLARHVESSARELPTVVCLPSVNPGPSAELSDAWRMLLLLHDRGASLRYADCRTGLVLANGGELQQIVLPDEETLQDMHPLLKDWLLGHALPPDPTLPPESLFALDVSEQLGDKAGSFTTTSILRLAPEAPGGAGTMMPPVTLEDNLTFLGHEPAEARRYAAGDVLTSVTWWRVDGPLPEDLRLFTHVMPDPVVITAQNDLISVLPASLQPRDVFIQVSYVNLPDSAPPGDYLVSVGAYRQRDERRLQVIHEGELRGTRLFLEGNILTVGDGEG